MAHSDSSNVWFAFYASPIRLIYLGPDRAGAIRAVRDARAHEASLGMDHPPILVRKIELGEHSRPLLLNDDWAKHSEQYWPEIKEPVSGGCAKAVNQNQKYWLVYYSYLGEVRLMFVGPAADKAASVADRARSDASVPACFVVVRGLEAIAPSAPHRLGGDPDADAAHRRALASVTH